MSPAWRFYLGFYRGSGRAIALSTLLIIGHAGLAIPIALLLKRIFDSALASPDLGAIATTAVAIPLLYVAGDGLLLVATRRNLRTTKSAILRLREALIEAAFDISDVHAPSNRTGRFHSVLVHDTERIDIMSNSLLSHVLPSLLSSIGLLAVLAVLNGPLFLVALLIIPAAWGAARLLHGVLQRRVSHFHSVFETFSTEALTVLQRLWLARVQGAEPGEIDRLVAHSRDLREAGYDVAWMSRAHGLLHGEAMVFAALLVLLVGSTFIAAGDLTVGTLIAFYFALGLLRSNLSVVLNQIPTVIAGNASLLRYHGQLKECCPRDYGGMTRIDFRGEISLEGVRFDERGLVDVTLSVRPGLTTGLSGPSGVGKTSIASLMLGLAEPCSGSVHADGHAYDELDLDHLRKQIGYAGQDPLIFAGTVRDNLRFGTRGPDSEIREALEIAGAASFVDELPRGLDTWLGENGARLSGGQRQRLSIARVVLRRPALLILDEPTNHLGSIAIHDVLDRFGRSNRHASILVVSHDPEILDLADTHYALEGGTIRSVARADTAGSRLAR